MTAEQSLHEKDENRGPNGPLFKLVQNDGNLYSKPDKSIRVVFAFILKTSRLQKHNKRL